MNHHLHRERLLALLDGAGAGCVATVVAGAGCGKSTLLRDWCSAAPAQRRLIALDDHETATDFAARLERLLTGLAGEAPRRGNGVAIDDLHLVDDPAAIDGLRRLVRQWPADATLLLASREPLPVPRFREATLAPFRRIDEAVLAFDDAELTAMCGGDQDRAAAVLAVTGRWPAGVAHVARSDDPAAAMASLHALVRAEIVAPLHPSERDFLAEIAFVAPMELSLLNAAFNRDDLGDTLAGLQVRGVPLLRVPAATDGVVAVEPVLADVLLDHMTESARSGARGRIDAAIRIARDRDAAEHVLALVQRRADPELERDECYAQALHLCLSGRSATLSAWIEEHDEDDVSTDPRLALPYALVLRPRETATIRALVDPYLGRPADGWPTLPDRRPVPTAARQVLALIGLGPCHAEDAVEDDLWGSVLSYRFAWQELAAGESDRATARLESEIVRLPGYAMVEATRLATLSILAAERADIADGTRLLDAAIEVAGRVACDDANLGLVLDVARMTSARRGLRTVEAHAIAQGIGRRAEHLADGWTLERLYSSLAVAEVLLDVGADLDEIVAVVRGAREIAAQWPVPAFGTRFDEIDRRLGAVRPRAGHVRGELELTAAELRVLRLLATHLSLPAIAERMYLSTNTVRSHRTSIFRKLGATSRSEAIERAHERRLLSGDGVAEEAPGA